MIFPPATRMGSTRALRQNTTQPTKRNKRFEMQNAVTTFASSRFVDREAVVATLRERAEWLKRCQAEVVAVYLFGFFATGSATPGISIGGVVGVSGAEKALRWEVWQVAFSSFPDAPVPVDVRVPLSAQLAQRMHTGRWTSCRRALSPACTAGRVYRE
jgi:hypothetical protein